MDDGQRPRNDAGMDEIGPSIASESITVSPTLNPRAENRSRNTPEPSLDPDVTQPSKRQIKKQQKKEAWEAGREARKAKRKEKNREKRARRRVALGDQPRVLAKKRLDQTRVPVTFVFDCDFDNLMHDGEKISIASQLTRCYSDNSRAPFCVHLLLASFTGNLKERFETVLQGDYKRWKDFTTTDGDFVEASQRAQQSMASDKTGKVAGALSEAKDNNTYGEVVYLTADGEETLTELKPHGVYIIGALVDRNRHKGICYSRAREKGVRTAKLPIGTYLKITERKALATNHVNEILLKWLEFGDWGKAFMKVVPKRKGGMLKDVDNAPVAEVEDEAHKVESGCEDNVSKLDKDKDGESVGNSEPHDED